MAVDVVGAVVLTVAGAGLGRPGPRPGAGGVTRIYLSPPEVGAEERRMLLDAFDSNWIAPVGPDLDAFEAELAARVGVEHAVALSSGTAALHLSLLLAGVGRRRRGPGPLVHLRGHRGGRDLCGCHPGLRGLLPVHLEHRSRPGGRGALVRARDGRLPAAVITVDLYGQSADYDRLRRPVRRLRRAVDRGRGGGPGGLVPGQAGRRLRDGRRVLLQREQDHHHQRRRYAGVAIPAP